MMTLTFDPKRRPEANRDQTLWFWRRLVEHLNTLKGGKRYRNKWGHSYFGYVAGVEHHRNGMPHLHVVVDSWVDYSEVIAWWFARCGFVKIRRVDNPAEALAYVLKYVVKDDGLPTWWFQPIRRSVDPETGGVFRATPRP
jgi:hypothetical protein